ncbi:PRC-barrel domain-containing protein [Phenylobacterium sp. LjRoot225]|uniref:PRC-barrel domain-containing protein n=1 Tax=Phenylobacterium sp. LjRoot225 TaxID=3342285 RepID=UPI003ECF02E5
MGVKSPHELIMSSRVTGTPVLNREGERIGHVEDLSIHKVSGHVIYAILSFGGFLGIGERFHPLPWSVLDYDPDRNGFVVSLEKKILEDAPSLTREELEALGAGDTWRTRLFDYYGRYGAVPYI